MISPKRHVSDGLFQALRRQSICLKMTTPKGGSMRADFDRVLGLDFDNPIAQICPERGPER